MEPTPRAPLTLYTFAMSHYSEKIRWTLDACDIPYREVCLSPAFHMGPALRMGGRGQTDRKSTRLNSSHVSYLVCRLLLEKKKS